MSTIAALALLLCAGCFENREAPYLPVTARSLDEAITNQAVVERVILAKQNLSGFPRELASMPKLTVLELRGTQGLGTLEGLADLKALKQLDLSATQMETVPDAVFALAGLERLYLSDNKIKELPAAIGNLTALSYLNVDVNQLGALPRVGQISGCAG